MKKLDHLNEGVQEVQSANSSHADEANADEEQQSTAVSQVQLTQLKSGLFILFFTQAWPSRNKVYECSSLYV